MQPERNLEPEEREFYCPLCGAAEPETIYVLPGEGAVGCSECLLGYEPWEYYERW